MKVKNLLDKIKFLTEIKFLNEEAERKLADVYIMIDDNDEDYYIIKGISIDDDNDLIIHAETQ